ncbi:sigma-70 family RNA polymerase sigma factor [Bacillus sp. EB01]|uniref:sigma-70 family RNA polymerase sigma factor n=1 Tax=Bacillus sp. EB01 TaxID=1347086 RepID=UPI000693DB18|nr:sigma-70 family RNA polymerase sigma factor [Bacillus sp. EB01]
MNTEDTLSELMDCYGTSILHLAYSYVRNHETAKDLAQEIFIKCYQKLDTFQGESAIQTWLYRIAINHCKDHVKSWHYRKVHTSHFFTSLLKGQQKAAEAEYLDQAGRQELSAAILQLPLKYKEVIILAYFHDMTMNEISAVCEVNANTVKSRIARAKELLKQSITERGGNDGEEITTGKNRDVKGRIG